MDLNKVFPKPKEVEERLKKNRNNQIIKLIYEWYWIFATNLDFLSAISLKHDGVNL